MTTAIKIAYVCPVCKGNFSESAEKYSCEDCSREFPVVFGIPDFRIFDDPYISIEDDRAKGLRVAKYYDELSFEELVRHYWSITPDVPDDLVDKFVASAVDKAEQSKKTWSDIIADGLPKSLLEIGCATSGFITASAPHIEKGVGVDIAFRWLVVAKKRLQEQGITNVQLVCACSEYLPFPEGSFDQIVSEDTLDHVRSQEGFMAESARVLDNQSGRLYVSIPNRFSLGPDPHVWLWGVGFLPAGIRDYYVKMRKGILYSPIQALSYWRLKTLLKRAGFSNINVIYPELDNINTESLSAIQRVQVKAYQHIRRIPIIRDGLRFIGPSFQVMCHRSEVDDSAGTV